VETKALRIFAVSWITLVLMGSGVSGMVLCIGADGHIALEMAHEGRCQDASDAPGHDHPGDLALTAVGGSDCCGDCVDLSLSSDAMSQPMPEVRHRQAPTDELTSILAASFTQAPLGARIGMGPLLLPRCGPPRASPALLAQRTVVLRI
jgi:hypothetical protein